MNTWLTPEPIRNHQREFGAAPSSRLILCNAERTPESLQTMRSAVGMRATPSNPAVHPRTPAVHPRTMATLHVGSPPHAPSLRVAARPPFRGLPRCTPLQRTMFQKFRKDDVQEATEQVRAASAAAFGAWDTFPSPPTPFCVVVLSPGK